MRPVISLVVAFIAFLSVEAAAKTAHSIRVAVVQLESSKVGNFSAMLSYAKKAKAQGAQMIVFPETSDMGWLNPKVFYEAAPIPGTTSNIFSKIARKSRLWLVAGLAERGKKIGRNPDTYEAFDSAILVAPTGWITLHHRKFNVLKNAFSECPVQFGSQGCSYTPGTVSETKVATTPFGTMGLLVCADAYTYDKTSLNALKPYRPDLVIIPWGVTAGSPNECGKDGFNATGYAAQAATYLQSAYVVGANATGPRPYGRFLPSVYCGTSGFAKPTGEIGGVMDTLQEMAIFEIPLGGQ